MWGLQLQNSKNFIRYAVAFFVSIYRNWKLKMSKFRAGCVWAGERWGASAGAFCIFQQFARLARGKRTKVGNKTWPGPLDSRLNALKNYRPARRKIKITKPNNNSNSNNNIVNKDDMSVSENFACEIVQGPRPQTRRAKSNQQNGVPQWKAMTMATPDASLVRLSPATAKGFAHTSDRGRRGIGAGVGTASWGCEPPGRLVNANWNCCCRGQQKTFWQLVRA